MSITYLCMTPCLTNSRSVMSLGQSGYRYRLDDSKTNPLTIQHCGMKLGWVEFVINVFVVILVWGMAFPSKVSLSTWEYVKSADCDLTGLLRAAGLQAFPLFNWTVNLLPSSNLQWHKASSMCRLSWLSEDTWKLALRSKDVEESHVHSMFALFTVNMPV